MTSLWLFICEKLSKWILNITCIAPSKKQPMAAEVPVARELCWQRGAREGAGQWGSATAVVQLPVRAQNKVRGTRPRSSRSSFYSESGPRNQKRRIESVLLDVARNLKKYQCSGFESVIICFSYLSNPHPNLQTIRKNNLENLTSTLLWLLI